MTFHIENDPAQYAFIAYMHVLCIMHYAIYVLHYALGNSLQIFASLHQLTLRIENKMQQGAMSICFGMHALCICINNCAIYTKHCA
jgi:hypothetical protein